MSRVDYLKEFNLKLTECFSGNERIHCEINEDIKQASKHRQDQASGTQTCIKRNFKERIEACTMSDAE